ncbi:cell envelope integrity protein CreD [Zooshikella sp. RANM57]|uniref:cell envelope integrity protein CreD n=1 Tax=Zooshikella sp. RANM57 TaxID=3425863 RepID=UPI003D6F4A05
MPTTFQQWLKQSQLLRIFILSILVLLLQIPLFQISDLVYERETRKAQTAAEIASKWGNSQILFGPSIYVPYTTHHVNNENGKVISEHHWYVILPQSMSTIANLSIEKRYRSLYEIPVYQADVSIKGHFQLPETTPDGLQWDKAIVAIKLNDSKALISGKLQWNNHPIDLQPGSPHLPGDIQYLHSSLQLDNAATNYTYNIQLKFNGTNELYIAPVGNESTISIGGNWADPSFQGNWLPRQRNIIDTEFQSQWQVPFLSRNIPQYWNDANDFTEALSNSIVGVKLTTPTDVYRQIHRAIKYDLLFIALTFIVIWLWEAMGRLTVHYIQYLLIGAGLCMFYLLTLALAEHIGFIAAYILASSSVILMITSYAWSVLKTPFRALLLGVILVCLYGFLYTLLQERDYSLLLGSVGLFLALSTVMYCTRKIDWNNKGNQLLNSKIQK